MNAQPLRLALAHAGEVHPPSALPVHWVLDPLALAAVLGGGGVYAAGVARLWRRAGRGRGLRGWEVACYAGGLLAVVTALLSPVDAISDVLLSAHMTQHELLMVVAAPLLVLGRPFVGLAWGLPAPARAAAGRVVHLPAVRRAWRGLTDPLAVLALHAVALWAWHVPPAFEAALHDVTVHALQHVCFFWTAALFWWAVVRGRYGRAGYGVSVAYTFLTALHSSVLGALLTFAGAPWYPTYATRSAAVGRAPLADQQVAGLVMWVPAGLVFLAAGLALFAAWMGESERRARAGAAARAARAGAVR